MLETPSEAIARLTSAETSYAVEEECRLLRARLAQREATIVDLNRRLRKLEQFRGSGETQIPQRLAESERLAEALQREVDAVYKTKTFRYTEALRGVYRRALIRRGRQ